MIGQRRSNIFCIKISNVTTILDSKNYITFCASHHLIETRGNSTFALSKFQKCRFYFANKLSWKRSSCAYQTQRENQRLTWERAREKGDAHEKGMIVHTAPSLLPSKQGCVATITSTPLCPRKPHNPPFTENTFADRSFRSQNPS